MLAARREAQAADIVVVNHYLLMADLVLKEEGFGDLLPGADAIVIDEAHQLPDVAAQFLGYSVSTRQLSNLSKDVAGELLLAQQMAGKVDGALSGLDAQVAAVLAVDGGPGCAARARAVAGSPARGAERPGRAREGTGRSDRAAGGADGQAAFKRLQERLEESAERLHALTAAEAPGGVRWAETSARNVSAHFAPVDVASQLSSLMEAQPCAWVLTSATLAVGDDFSHFKRRSGLTRATTVRFESPFRFREPGADVPAEGTGRARCAGARAQRDQCRAARARGQRWPRVHPVHEPPRPARRRRGTVSGTGASVRRTRC